MFKIKQEDKGTRLGRLKEKTADYPASFFFFFFLSESSAGQVLGNKGALLNLHGLCVFSGTSETALDSHI